jgi:hypothetical protein
MKHAFGVGSADGRGQGGRIQEIDLMNLDTVTRPCIGCRPPDDSVDLCASSDERTKQMRSEKPRTARHEYSPSGKSRRGRRIHRVCH